MIRILHILLLILTFSFCSVGQDTTISKQNIKRIFKENAQGTMFDWKKRDWSDDANSMHFDKYNSWTTCNSDSMYYRSDTLTFYNHQYYYFNLDCGWYKEWSFKPKNQIYILDTKPPMSVVTSPNTVKVTGEDSGVYIEIKDDDDKVIDKFRVIGLNITYQDKEKEEKCYKLTLTR